MTNSALLTISNDIYDHAENLYLGIEQDTDKDSNLKTKLLKFGKKLFLFLLKSLTANKIHSFLFFSFILFISAFNFFGVEMNPKFVGLITCSLILILIFIIRTTDSHRKSNKRLERLSRLVCFLGKDVKGLDSENSINILITQFDELQKRVAGKLYSKMIVLGIAWCLFCYYLVSKPSLLQENLFEILTNNVSTVILFLSLVFVFSSYRKSVDEIFSDIRIALNEKLFKLVS
jgi:hypothetical protein